MPKKRKTDHNMWSQTARKAMGNRLGIRISRTCSTAEDWRERENVICLLSRTRCWLVRCVKLLKLSPTSATSAVPSVSSASSSPSLYTWEFCEYFTSLSFDSTDWLAICRPSGCTVVSGVVVVVVGVCNRSQMKTSKCTCIIFGLSMGLDPG